MSKARDCLLGVRGFLLGLHPTKLVVLGYLSYVVVGWALLCLPFARRVAVGANDNLFTAMSAVSTTGLVTVSISDSYTPFGQGVVLVLIQLGGVGYMTFGSCLVLSRKKELTSTRGGIGQTVFSLPQSFRIDKFIRSVIVFTAVIETAGALALYGIFRAAGDPSPAWNAVFHSVSAFCTAGFSLFNASFESYADHAGLNLVIAGLSYLGAVGFIVCVDCWRRFTGKVQRITLTSKIILWSTFWLSLLGTLLILVGEPTLRELPPGQRLVAAFFQSMTAMTTVGFNTVSIGELSKATLLLLTVLMVIGASPSGTGGGLKSTTFTAILGVMRSALRGHGEVRFWGRSVPAERVWTAVAGLGFYLLLLIAGTYLLELTESAPSDQLLFEAASALGTVGLSTGVTAGLTGLGKLIVTFLMFCGRLGPLTFGMALFFRSGFQGEQEDADLAV